jgi:hypothetical protein
VASAAAGQVTGLDWNGTSTATWTNPALTRSPSSSRSGSPLRNMSGGSPLLGQLLRVNSWSGSKQGACGLLGDTPGCHSGSAPVTRQNSGGLKELVEKSSTGSTGATGAGSTVDQESEAALRQKEIEEAVLQAVLAALRPEVVAAARGHTKAVQQVQQTLTAKDPTASASTAAGERVVLTPAGVRGQAPDVQQDGGSPTRSTSNSPSSSRPPWIRNTDAAAAVQRRPAGKEPATAAGTSANPKASSKAEGNLGISSSSSSIRYSPGSNQVAAGAVGQQGRSQELSRVSRSSSSSSSSAKSGSSNSTCRSVRAHGGSGTHPAARRPGPAGSGSTGINGEQHLTRVPGSAATRVAAARSVQQDAIPGATLQLPSLISTSSTTSSSSNRSQVGKQVPASLATQTVAIRRGPDSRKGLGPAPALPVYNPAVHGSYEAFLDEVLGSPRPPNDV